MTKPLRIKSFSKIDASVMMYALFVSVIILIVISALFLFSYINRTTISSYHLKERLRLNCSSGINLLLADTTYQYGETYWLDLYDTGIDSVEIQKSKWGLFDLLRAKAWYKGLLKQKMALAGGFYPQTGTQALYLADQGSPLCVCGNTDIQGDCALPVAGIKRGYVEGRHYTGSELLKGNVSYSKPKIPFPGPDVINAILGQFNIEPDHENWEIINSDDIGRDSVYRSFSEKTLVIYEPDRLSIDAVTLIGNIILASNGDILIGSQSKLDGVLCYGKSIYILPETQAKMQCLARDTIWVGENSNLQYPSSLGLLPDTVLQNNKLIRFNEGSRIKGVITDLTTSADPELDLCAIKIGKSSQIFGQLYTRNSMEMRGSISGQVITGKFHLPTASSLYVNHLLDVGIDITTMPQDFIGYEFLQINKPKKVIKWLH